MDKQELTDDYRRDRIGEIKEIRCHTCWIMFKPTQEEIDDGEEPACPYCQNPFSGHD